MYKISYIATRMIAEAAEDTGKAPTLGVLGDISVQLCGMFIDALYKTADIRLLLGVRDLLVDAVLRGRAADSAVRRSFSRASMGLSGKAQLIGKMDSISRAVFRTINQFVLFSLQTFPSVTPPTWMLTVSSGTIQSWPPQQRSQPSGHSPPLRGWAVRIPL